MRGLIVQELMSYPVLDRKLAFLSRVSGIREFCRDLRKRFRRENLNCISGFSVLFTGTLRIDRSENRPDIDSFLRRK